MLELQEISDRIEIADLLSTYTRAIDVGAWDRLDDVFTADAHIDYTTSGGIAGDFPEVKAWLAEVLPAFPRRQHIIAQSEVVLDGDSAKVTAYFLNPMTVPQQDGSELLWECGGYYHHRLIRTPDGWRSRELVEETVWTR